MTCGKEKGGLERCGEVMFQRGKKKKTAGARRRKFLGAERERECRTYTNLRIQSAALRYHCFVQLGERGVFFFWLEWEKGGEGEPAGAR